MSDTIREIEDAMDKLGKGSPWSPDSKVSEDFLLPLFNEFFKKLNLPNLMQKTDYHQLAYHVPRDEIGDEVSSILDEVVRTSQAARPKG